MKKMNYFFAALIMVAALVSCEKEQGDVTLLKKGDAKSVPVSLDSKAGVLPVVIPGANNGGNRTCADVEAAFELPENFLFCWDKIDYSDGEFMGEFPDGLTVTVTDGKFVSFKMDDCLKFGDKFYKVGAVIVKGSNEANVYYYKGGIMEDSGLASPVNASGKPAGLSNLSFCFVECEVELPELVIAVKTYFSDGSWAVSGGLGIEGNLLHMGYNNYIYEGENNFVLNSALLSGIIGPVGTITARDFWEGNQHYLEVVIDTEDPAIMFGNSYLYVGSLEGYTGRYYENFPFKSFEMGMDPVSPQRVFKIGFNEILM
jgi:hypothetical protein